MNKHEKINYVELPAADLNEVKQFFMKTFGWTFTDFGEEYTAFSDQGLDGGFCKSDKKSTTKNGAALFVFYSEYLEATKDKVTNNNGEIVEDIFSFPGGRRFHFCDPNGNEYAVWSDK